MKILLDGSAAIVGTRAIRRYTISLINEFLLYNDSDQFKIFLNNITKAKVITGLKNAIQEEIDTRNNYMAGKQTEVDKLIEFKSQIDSL